MPWLPVSTRSGTYWGFNVSDSKPIDTKLLKEQVTKALRRVFDPEIPVNIYDLGLIYRCDVSDTGNVAVDMTLTAPGCPVAQTFPLAVENEIKKVEGVKDAHVEVVWDPPWSPDRMSEAAKVELGMF
ncbi:MAG: SUF system Fe-S cluster assembly protein [Gammaproteobacteria bacterium]|nr:SUF system Fe-S cluster assembly protein [Gammaproteobacteria bacterium]